MTEYQVNFYRYQPLLPHELEQVKRASLDILSQVGIRMEDPGIVKKMAAAGAETDYHKGIVRFPEQLLLELIATCPKQVTLCGREERYDIYLDCQHVYMGTGGNVLNILDLETGERRPSLLSDLQQIARLADALANIDFFIIPLYPHDVSLEKVDINSFYHSLVNTRKHVMGGINDFTKIERLVQMADELSGGTLRRRPRISFIASMVSPLKIPRNSLSLLDFCGKEQIPVVVAPAPIAGVTAPVTLAGTLAQQNAETLAGLAVAQALHPGAPVLYGSVNSNADFRNMSFLFGSTEMALMNAASVQVAHSYGLPLYTSGGVTDAKIPDAQAGIEKALSLGMVALAGGDYIHLAAGMLESGLTVAYEQFVMDNEILGMVRRAVQGVVVDQDRLALDAIKAVGPGGNFLTNPATIRFMREEYFFPQVNDRAPWEKWFSEGGKDLRQRCLEQAKELIYTYEVEYPADTDRVCRQFPEIISRGEELQQRGAGG